MAFEIRFATKDDIENIINITREAFALYKERSGAKSVDALTETYEDVLYDIENKLVFVAIDNNEMVGCVRVEIKDDKNAWLTRFAVKVSSHNSGKKLLARIDKVMAENDVKSISLYTASDVASLMSFYGSCGFVTESTDTSRGYKRVKLLKKYT